MVPESIVAKLAGAGAGTVLALLFILPKTLKEAIQRGTVSFIVGYVFGSPAVHYWLIADTFENIVAASCAAAWAAWWAMGMGYKFIRNWQGPKG